MKKQNEYFVTHIIVPDIPEKGVDQVFYYSATNDSYNEGKYFWGKGNNTVDQEFINDLINREKIFILASDSYPMRLMDDESIWVDSKANLYIADIKDPYKNQRALEKQEKLKRKMIEKVYGKSIANTVLPEVSRKIFIKV